MNDKIVRSVCYFAVRPDRETVAKLTERAGRLSDAGYLVQTKRICTSQKNISEVISTIGDGVDYVGIGSLTYDEALNRLSELYNYPHVYFNIDLTSVEIDSKYADLLFRIIAEKPERTFNFTFVFNNAASSPFFPSGQYDKNGFSVGLQPTDLSRHCATLEAWLEKMMLCWQEIVQLFGDSPDFIGIDSSTAPLNDDSGSFVRFVEKLGYTFSRSTTTDLYVKITRFIKEHNPKPAGLCGLMLPCLEDKLLAAEYEKGNFSIERNIFLSLHSGLGIDTYPISAKEDPARIMEILRLMQALSAKYKKPLSARFVSDGTAQTGERTDFKNNYLTDVVLRPL